MCCLVKLSAVTEWDNSAFVFSQRYHQDSSAKHEQREQGTVPGGHTGQGHGWPDGGFIWNYHSEHHTDRCQ